jgi:hypothetical protein
VKVFDGSYWITNGASPPWSYFAGVLVHELVHALNLGLEPQAKDLARLFRLELGYGAE